ncbi:MAG: hypothetical protein EOP24_32525 [Hyphomicrobiales bacterium]|nr:MAG: hypothetical protein EOP24_32525 [Hyphomicrobiales bacterium]
MPQKIKLNPRGALASHQESAQATADDRFEVAQRITTVRPHALAPDSQEGATSTHVFSSPPILLTQGFSLESCLPGSIALVPLHLIDVNPLGPRQIYRSEEIDKIAETIAESQDDAAHGFVLAGRVKLIDGGTRYRSAKLSGAPGLVVKFEEAPANGLQLYLKARRYNDQRSQPTAIDHALSMKKLMDAGEVTSHRQLAEQVPDLNGGKMSDAQVSVYMRISRMPERVLLRMSEHTQTSALTVLYAVSEIFERDPEGDLSPKIEMALRIIDDIRDKELSKKQVQELVKARLEGVKTRERSAQHLLKLGQFHGYIKLFGKRGQLDLQLKGVSEGHLEELQRELTATIEAFANRTARRAEDSQKS